MKVIGGGFPQRAVIVEHFTGVKSNLNSCFCPAGIFSVLSLASECTTLAAELPKVSYVKALDVWLIACLLFGFASLVEYAVVQVMLNNPKRVEAEKARIAKAEQADGKGGSAAKKNTVNGTGTPVHISTLQVRMTSAIKVHSAGLKVW